MKKLSAACMILGLSLFVGGCSNDQIDDHIISLQDKISDATSSDPTSREASDSSLEERVYMDEITGTLQNFDGTNMTISSDGETYVFDVSRTRLECKYGVVFSDQVSVIYQGQLSGTDISTISPIKVTDKYHNETPLENRTLKGKEQHLRAKIVSVSTSTMTVVPQTTGSELTVPLTSVPVYFKGGMAPGSYVNIIYTGKFNGESTNGMKIRGITGEDPDTLSIRNISSTVTGTILGTTANTVLIQTYDGVKILCSRENVQDLSTSGMEEGADLRVTFNPAKSRTSNIYTCIKFEDP